MSKEINEDACGLDMPHGLHGIDYPQKFVYADKSQFPSKPIAHPGKEAPSLQSMMKTMT